jgi:hypothetical protein
MQLVPTERFVCRNAPPVASDERRITFGPSDLAKMRFSVEVDQFTQPGFQLEQAYITRDRLWRMFQKHGIQAFQTQLHEREAYRALFSFGGTLEQLVS